MAEKVEIQTETTDVKKLTGPSTTYSTGKPHTKPKLQWLLYTVRLK